MSERTVTDEELRQAIARIDAWTEPDLDGEVVVNVGTLGVLLIRRA